MNAKMQDAYHSIGWHMGWWKCYEGLFLIAGWVQGQL